MPSQHSFRANCMQVKGTSLPSHPLILKVHPADLALLFLGLQFVSPAGTTAMRQWAVKTFQHSRVYTCSALVWKLETLSWTRNLTQILLLWTS